MRIGSHDSEHLDQSVVVCLDPEPERRLRTAQVLECTAARVEVAAQFASIEQWAERAAVIVVSADSGLVLPSTSGQRGSASALARLAELGIRTVGYGPGLSQASLEKRCELLLAGVEVLVDSDVASFANDLMKEVCPALERHRLRRVAQQRIDEALRAMGVVAVSPAMRSTMRNLVRIAEVGVIPVLVRGETGTGKEIAAKILHTCDPNRRSGPFVPVNCAALSKTLAESELFGHRRGAFSGAMHDRAGLVRAADGGVLFLDEIGELDLELQGKLLRVIQEGRVLSVGDECEHAVDVRVVAATHRDLGALVDTGQFRLDLFHRLVVVSVCLPPLRERPEDIAVLARHFVQKYSGSNGALLVKEVGTDFLAAVARMRLPGNVRELENVVRSALAARDHEGPLSLRDVPRETLREIASTPPPGPSSPDDAAAPKAVDWNLERAVDSCERTLITAALAKCKGNQVAAARLLGVTPRTVFNKVRRHGLKQSCG